ncbi:MAG: tripartite tricarboxylate transporter substrate binding protein, partial [Burkholderiales bacterium]
MRDFTPVTLIATSPFVLMVHPNAWYGVFGPAGLPAEIAAKIQGDVTRVLAEPAMREKIIAQRGEPVGTTPAEFDAFVKRE